MSGETRGERQAATQGAPRETDFSISSTHFRRLRPGPGLSREQVAADQRSRLQRAMTEIVATHGYEALTVRGLTKRARISSGTFYSHYRSADDCFLATLERTCERFATDLLAAGEKEPEPQRRLALAVDRLFRDLLAAPQAATFMLRSAPAAGPAFDGAMHRLETQLGVSLDRCLREQRDSQLPPLLLGGIGAGLARVGRLRLPALAEHEIEELAGEAADWIIGLCAPCAREVKLLAAMKLSQSNALTEPEPMAEEKPPEQLGDARAMILAAAFRIAKSGYGQLTVPRICRNAGVARREFNRHFTSVEDCFLAALEERVAGALAIGQRERPEPGTWSRAVCAAARTLCSSLEDDVDSARVLLVEITAAGTAGIDRRDQLISRVARTLRSAAPEEERPSKLAAEASTAAAWAVLRRRTVEGSFGMAAAPLAHLLLAPTAKVQPAL